MAERLQPPRGTQDLLPDDWQVRRRILDVSRRHMDAAGFGQITTPTFEDTALFARGVGEHTDVVSKEMYTFDDRSGRSLTLRPEGTAPIVRAFITHGMHKWPQPVRLWYTLPMFRYEAPQKGRLREHTQLGAELFGAGGPAADAEVIVLLHGIYAELGVPDLALRINTIGDASTRPAYRQLLVEHLEPYAASFSDEARVRLRDNPLRLFDSRDEAVQAALADAPRIREHVSAACASHFAEVCALLTAAGVPFEVDDSLVRGFDYYTHTTFEFTAGGLGAQNAIGGGGRYDGLVAHLGGPETPAVGFGSGLERLALALHDRTPAADAVGAFAYVVIDPEDGRERGFALLAALRRRGVAAQMELGSRSRNGQIKAAIRSGAQVALLCDSDEPQIMRLSDRSTETTTWDQAAEQIAAIKEHAWDTAAT